MCIGCRVDREGLSEKVTLNCNFRGEKDADVQLGRIVGLDVDVGGQERDGSRVTFLFLA